MEILLLVLRARPAARMQKPYRTGEIGKAPHELLARILSFSTE
jgi:hypothetical protein